MTKTDLPDGQLTRDDEEYWDRLALRVATAARDSRRGAFDWIATSRIAWITTFLVVAAVLTALIRPIRETEQLTRAQWAQIIAPSDSLGQAIIARDGPPPIAALIVSERAR